MYVHGYNNNSSTCERTDPYFAKFISERYSMATVDFINRLSKECPRILETRDYKEVHCKYAWGTPDKTSAFRNLIRFTNPITDPEEKVWLVAESWAMQHFSFMGESKICWDFDYCTSSLNQQSSPGFPYSRKEGRRPALQTKAKYFAYQDGDYARNNFHQYLEMISKEHYEPLSWYTCTVKKEMRKVKKIKANDYRAYLAANVDNSAAGNGATLDMTRKFYEAWATSASFVGGSTFHGAWNILFRRLQKHKNGCEMDVSAWDATLGEALINSLKRVMWSFVRSSDRTEINRVR